MTSQVPEQSRQRIVVGVDGSEESRAALRWAADEAAAHGAELEVVCAWELPFSGLAAGYSPEPVGLPDPQRIARQTEQALDQTLQQVLGDQAASGVQRLVEGGDPARVLIDRARHADLLVVGSRGHGGFAGLLTGSVSEKCVRHAPCPVAVVRPKA